jgi:hypothetical protein
VVGDDAPLLLSGAGGVHPDHDSAGDLTDLFIVVMRRELDACVEEVENTLNVWGQVIYDRVVLDYRHHRGERSQGDRPLRYDAVRGGVFAGLVRHGAITSSPLSRVSTNWRLIVTQCYPQFMIFSCSNISIMVWVVNFATVAHELRAHNE